MSALPYRLPPAPELVRLLAGYAQWAAALCNEESGLQADALTEESLFQIQPDFGDVNVNDLVVYQTHFSGQDWQGEFNRSAYLCLSEAEARMVAHEVQRPSRKRGRLYFSWWLNVSSSPVPLRSLLASAEGRNRLLERLQTLLRYPLDDYRQADTLCYWMHGGKVGHWLYRDGHFMPPHNPEKNLPVEMRFDQPTKVWSPEGLGGLIDGKGCFLLPCQFAYLSDPHNGLIETRTTPLPPVTPPVDHDGFLRYTCDILAYRSGQQVKPPGVSALQGSLCVMGEQFVACQDDMDFARPRMGFMNSEGLWLGRSDWADVLLFNDDFAAVKCPDTGLWGFINEHGEVVVPPLYANGSFFNSGVAIVPLPKAEAVNGARWVLIDSQGAQLTGPWHDIELGRGDTYQVRDGAGRWGLVNKRGAMLVEPMTIGEGTSEDERTNILSTQFKEQRRGNVAERLANLSLAQAVVEFNLKSERDFYECGLWRKKVNVLRVPANWQDTFGPSTQGQIGWSYPVSANLFNFEKECPVLLERESGDPLSLGIPWVDLELCR